MSSREAPQNSQRRSDVDAGRAFERFINDAQRLDQVVHLSMRGIATLERTPQLAEALLNYRKVIGEPVDAEPLELARQEAELAAREVADGFPVLLAQAVVSLWSLLEAAIRSFVADWIRKERGALDAKPIQKLRVRVGEYEKLREDERYALIVELLEREVGVGLRSGVSRFEALLEPFGLAGSVDRSVRKGLFELAQVRNVIVHRAGVVDAQFAESCPWLELQPGDELRVSHEMLRRYMGAAGDYILQVLVRLGEGAGADMSEFKRKPGDESDVD